MAKSGEGQGDGPQGLPTPDNVRELQITLYRKAKAERSYRFWSLYGEVQRTDVLETAWRKVVANGGAAGVDGETIEQIGATPESERRWLQLSAMASEKDAQRIEAWIDEAVQGGARIVTGGKRDKAVYAPTVVADVKPEMRISCQELFGPAVAVIPVTALVKPPLLLAPQSVNSSQPPFCDVVRFAAEWEQRDGVLNVGVLPGYCYSDVPEVGLSIVAITDNDPVLARTIGESVAHKAWDLREEFVRKLTSPVEAVRTAIQETKGPVILVDSGDNVGGGGSADGTVLLHELFRQNARDAVMVIHDSEVVEQCFRAGVGGEVSARVGGKTDKFHGVPVPLTGRVRLLSDGHYINRGPMHGMSDGVEWHMGRCAVLDCNGITLLLTEHRVMPLNIHQLKSQGIQPEYTRILVVKAAHSYRPSYEPIAGRIIEVDTPGLTTTDLSTFPFRNIKRCLYPLYTDAKWNDTIVLLRE